MIDRKTQMAMLSENIIESTLTNATSLLLILFTYVIPLLSSIRTIHNRDKESYTQWLAYWLLVHILSPLFNLLKFYKIFHLSLVLWLSLPRFQGATLIYHEVVDTFLKKYSVADKVDDKIDTMKKSVRDAMWNIAKDVGWGFLYQIGGVVSFVQDSAASFVDENTPSNKSQRNSDNNYIGTDDIDIIDEADDTDDADGYGIKDENSDDAVVHPKRNTNFRQPSFSSSIGSQPSHSVYESFSSLTSLTSSVESDLASSEKEAYVSDFLDMLEKGLYVFSWHNNSSIIYQQYNDYDEDVKDNSNSDMSESKKFRLQIFTFHRGSEESDENGDINDSSYFVFNSVESKPGDEKLDVISFPVSVTTRVQESGTNSIQFVTSVKLSDIAPSPIVSMSQSASEPSLTKTSIIGSSTSSLLSTVSEGRKDSDDVSATKDSTVEEIVAEIVLSDDQDRNVLLAGLNIFLSRNVE